MIAELEKQCFSDPWSLRTIEDAFRQKDYFIYVWRDMKRVSGYVIGRLAGQMRENCSELVFCLLYGISALEHGWSAFCRRSLQKDLSPLYIWK